MIWQVDGHHPLRCCADAGTRFITAANVAPSFQVGTTMRITFNGAVGGEVTGPG
jgi:hypothetical protein